MEKREKKGTLDGGRLGQEVVFSDDGSFSGCGKPGVGIRRARTRAGVSAARFHCDVARGWASQGGDAAQDAN